MEQDGIDGIEEALTRPADPDVSRLLRGWAYRFYVDIGRPRRADQVLRRWEVEAGIFRNRLRLLDTTYGPLSRELADEATASIEGRLRQRAPEEYSTNDLRDLIALELSRVTQRDFGSTATTIEDL